MSSESKKVTCLVCPFACNIEVVFDEKGQITAVHNYHCKRGKLYAEQEIRNPVRILTTTIKLQGCDEEHHLLPVQSEQPISKHLLLACMKELAQITVKAPIRYNQAVVKDILNSGVNIVSTTEVKKQMSYVHSVESCR